MRQTSCPDKTYHATLEAPLNFYEDSYNANYLLATRTCATDILTQNKRNALMHTCSWNMTGGTLDSLSAVIPMYMYGVHI